jgi:UDP-N-acetyl-D-mannosaminuronic acid dehydrogenase
MTPTFNKISMIGLGYIGLPTAAVFASRKIEVVGVDVSQSVVDTVNRGEIHIVEPELDMIVSAAVSQGYLRASTQVEEADAFLIAVPTPFKGDHEPDLSFVKSAALSIAPVLKKGDLVVLESTSPAGTTELLVDWISGVRPDLRFPCEGDSGSDVHVAYCPERVLPGKVLHELVSNDRVIGGISSGCSKRAIELYKIFVEGECFSTDARTAEMCKLTENAFRDVNIAFANELSMICDDLGVDVWELIKLANRHPRVAVLRPGPGVGGHCIAVDPWFIVAKSPEKAKLIRVAREVNNNKPRFVVKQVESAVAAWLETHPSQARGDILLACYGLAFKPDIDDFRGSPALCVAEALLRDCGLRTLIVEPKAPTLPDSLNGAQLVSFSEAQKSADIHVVLVAHSEFLIVEPPLGMVVDAVGAWS